jgi:hypothetical protein
MQPIPRRPTTLQRLAGRLIRLGPVTRFVAWVDGLSTRALLTLLTALSLLGILSMLIGIFNHF